MPDQQQVPSEVYATFCDSITQDSVKRIFGSLSFATTNNVQHIHLLLQSMGGSVGDGICLYNFLKTFPIELTVYNCGSVASIAVLPYIAASKRKTSAGATFMIHRTTGSAQPTSATRLHSLAETVVLDDKRTEAILRKHIKLSDEEWAALDKQDLWFSAEEAVKAGFADEIGDFSPPKGSAIYAI